MPLGRSTFDDLINSGTLEYVTDLSLKNKIISIQSDIERIDENYVHAKNVWEDYQFINRGYATKNHVFFLCVILLVTGYNLKAQNSYLDYHYEIIEAEQLIVEHRFEEALSRFDDLFEAYDFVFVRDYKVATQLAVVLQNKTAALEYMRRAIGSGWEPQEIKKNKLAEDLFKTIPESLVDSLQNNYDQILDKALREKVHDMYKADQKMAIKNLLKIGQAAKARHAEAKFAPHSEDQLKKVTEILKNEGYPGEQLIGNDLWMSIILSHHNSISSDHTKNDTLYPNLRPLLLSSLDRGQISPFEIALIENWRIASQSNHQEVSYGYLGPALDPESLEIVNVSRQEIGLRSIELRNALVKIQEETGINFFLQGEPWQTGEIQVALKK